MTKDASSTRRSFLKVGAAAAAPIAVAVPAAAMAEDRRKARLQRLEDEAAIRDLHQALIRKINTGERGGAAELFLDPSRARIEEDLRAIVQDHAGEPDRIKVSSDGQSASGRYACVVELEVDLGEDCTLARMAHLQGGGFIRETQRRVLKASYARSGGAWAIAKVEFEQT
jgi:hypothetical protein